MYVHHVEVTARFELDEAHHLCVELCHPGETCFVALRPGVGVDIVGGPGAHLCFGVVAAGGDSDGGAEDVDQRKDVIGGRGSDDQSRHFPMQKLEKMRPSRSSLVNSPVISLSDC